MSGELIDKKIDAMLQMSAAELKRALPLTLDEIGRYGIEKALGEAPDLLTRIIKKLIEVDAAKFVSEVPEVSDKFMDLFWEGIGALTPKSKELMAELKSERLMSVLTRTNQINVNIEADDSPLSGHFTISQGKISGGSGLLHFKDKDFRIFGPTEVLLTLLLDELALGFSNPKLMTDGHPAFSGLVRPVTQGIAKIIKGG